MGKRPSSRIRSIYFAIRNLLSNALLSEFGCSPASRIASPYRSQYLGYQSHLRIPVSDAKVCEPGALPPLSEARRLISMMTFCLVP